ncbi:MAG: nucleoside-triphosphatase [Anaerolineae bacterium]
MQDRSCATVLLTGPRGVGKTTLCLRTVARAKNAGYSCAGLLTLQEDEDRRVVVDVRTDDRHPLTASGPTGVPVGRYLFDPDALAWGAEILTRSTPCDLLVLDELGPLEMTGGGWAVGMDVLREGHFLLALVVVRLELVTEVLERFPDAWVVEVTPENRDGLPAWLAGLLAADRRSAP